MSIKDTSETLKDLVSSVTSSPSVATKSPVDDMPDELEPEPLFDINYAKCKKEYLRKARNTIKKIVRLVITDPEMIDKSFIADKIETDAEQLGFMYYQRALCEYTQQANLEAIRLGNVGPRLIEVFTGLSKQMTDLSKQINDFENSILERYQKIKFDFVDDNYNPARALPGNDSEQDKSLASQNIFIGGRSINKSIAEEKKKLIEARMKAEETQYEEVSEEE